MIMSRLTVQMNACAKKIKFIIKIAISLSHSISPHKVKISLLWRFSHRFGFLKREAGEIPGLSRNRVGR